MRYAMTIAYLFLLATPSEACMNFTERIPGIGIEDVEFYRLGMVEIDRGTLHAYITEKGAVCGKRPGRACSDLVIAHLYAKQFAAGLALSTELVHALPNEYTVVITHAAALELNGKAAEAIPFMKRALDLNSGSHKGSEWIHLNLLKARVRGGVPDPWTLIGIDLRPDSAPHAPPDVDLKQLVKQVHFQVNDRHFFTPENDTLFGALMFAYADLLTLNGYRSQAKAIYEMAHGYGFTYSKSLEEASLVAADTLRSMEPVVPTEVVMSTPDANEKGVGRILWLVLALVGGGLALILLRRRAGRRSS